MIELSMLDGTWQTVRATMLEGETSVSEFPQSFEAIAQEYYETWVKGHNKGVAAKKSFLNRLKSRPLCQ